MAVDIAAMGAGGRRRLVAAALLAGALGVLPQVHAADGPPLSNGPDPALPPDASVFVVALAGGTPRLVTPQGELAYDPEWHPRSGALVVASERGLLELAGARWERRRTLYSGAVWSPSFSPNGSTLAFVDSAANDVALLSLSSGGVRWLTRSWRADGFVDWAPSGKELAVTRQGAILRVRADGHVLATVTHEHDTCFGPAWHPSARRLAFACLSPLLVVRLRDRGVTSTLTRDVPAAFPAWSPDGRRLAYSKFVDGSWELVVRDVKTGRERRVLRTPYDEVDPAWSPDGRRLAFVSNAP